jgi:hypothetical protein
MEKSAASNSIAASAAWTLKHQQCATISSGFGSGERQATVLNINNIPKSSYSSG